MTTTVSIVTAVYNRAAIIDEALDSLAGQSSAIFEHIVIDGGSTDGTVERLEARRSQIAVLVSEPDRGIYDALNKGVARASGDVVGILHSDDRFADQRVLADVAAEFEDHSVDAVYGDLQYVRKDSPQSIVRHWRAGLPSPQRLRRGWMPPHPALFLRRRVFARHGAYDLRYKIAADYDFMLRVFMAGIEHRYIPRVLVKMRVGGASNGSLRRLWRKSSEDWRVMSHAGLNPASALFGKIVSKVPQFLGSSPPAPAEVRSQDISA